MELLNAVGLILGIISSSISIYIFVVERRARRSERAAAESRAQEATAAAAGQPHRPPPPPPPPPPRSRSAAAPGGSLLRAAHKFVAVIWAILGVGCILEGLEFGDGILLMLGGGFCLLAYKFWPRDKPAAART